MSYVYNGSPSVVSNVLVSSLLIAVAVCVCVFSYFISRYMQPRRAMIAAPPKAVRPFLTPFFPMSLAPGPA